MLYLDAIVIAKNRIRKQFDEDHISDLANSIASKGMLNPITVDHRNGAHELVAGETRMRAVDRLHDLDIAFFCNGHRVPKGKYPALLIADLPEDLRLEAELEENTKRRDLTWQEQADARARLFGLRKKQAESEGKTYSAKTLATELEKAGVKATSVAEVTQDLRLAKHLNDPEVAKAKTSKDALKIIKKKTLDFFTEHLSNEVAKETWEHTLFEGDCREVIKTLQGNQFPVILTDPPYGIDVQDAGSQISAQHHYEDGSEVLMGLLNVMPEELFRVATENAHLYWFCDFTWIGEISIALGFAGWEVDPYPIIWNKNGRGVAPDTQFRYRRTYECILFATKGARPLLELRPDVITVSPTADLQQAEKPVELLVQLLKASAQSGDRVLDFCAGSGSIFLAATQAKCIATGIELNTTRAALARTRLSGER